MIKNEISLLLFKLILNLNSSYLIREKYLIIEDSFPFSINM